MFRAQFDPDGHVRAPRLIAPAAHGHKYDRGHAYIIMGPHLHGGAARLAARAALRIGAGLVTLVGEEGALAEPCRYDAIMRRVEDAAFNVIGDKARVLLIGPGRGVGQATTAAVLTLLDRQLPMVLDADALTSFADAPDRLFAALRPDVVLTPHAGEFGRLFPDIDPANPGAAARAAAARCGAVVLLKGAVTQIAAPDGAAAWNDHSSSWLATAGAGDVLGGMIAGLIAQGMAAGEAAAVAAWLHGDAGLRLGPGLIADDLPDALPSVMAALDREEP